jgi:hypothetical protein
MLQEVSLMMNGELCKLMWRRVSDGFGESAI